MHHKKTENQGIKLVAHDGESAHFLSALLQDGISCGAWIFYKNNTFKLLINRICWELPKNYLYGENYIARLHSILTINHVKHIQTKQISKKIEFFSIFSILCDFDTKKKTHNIKIILSKGIINITVDKFLITLKDVSTYWLTSKIPSHISVKE
jgi:hypothetical protein